MYANCLPRNELIDAANRLKDLGLVEVQKSNGEFYTARLTVYGKRYKRENPKLRNGISDTKKWVISIIITSMIAIVTLVIGIIFK